MGRRPKQPNTRLRGLILEAGFSNKGLARRVNALGAAKGVPELRYDHSSVIRWLAGEHPRDPVPKLITEVFTMQLGRRLTPADLGMEPVEADAGVGLEFPLNWTDGVRAVIGLWRADVERRRFLVESGFAVSAYSAAALRWLTAPPVDRPTSAGRLRVGPSDVEAIREVTRTARAHDNRLGGGRFRATVVQYLNAEVTPLLRDSQYRVEVGAQLFSAAAELTQVAGWMAYDLEQHGLAQRYMVQALRLARTANDSALGGEVLAAMSHQAVYVGRAEDGIDLARAAQANARRAGMPLLLAECQVAEAHGHAVRRDQQACKRALSESERTFTKASSSGPSSGPTWLSYFDEAYLAAKTAHCFRELGRPAETERFARRSLRMDGRYVRGQTFNMTMLAGAYARQGEAESAVHVGRQALDLASGLDSMRTRRYLRGLRQALQPYASGREVREFVGQLDLAVSAGSARTVRQ
ncbi:MAG: hypothetical protein GEV11_25210 [Streptosporangiales bacterium]|nr:hypothetical protein [Streptosporangiales bacterium]